MANGQMVTGFWLKLTNGNRLRFHSMSDAVEPEVALAKAFRAADKDRQRWYASQQFPGQKIEIIPGVR